MRTMAQRVTSIAIFCVMMAVFSLAAQAQTVPPCPGNECPLSPFIDQPPIILLLVNYHVRVHYAIRTACNGHFDISIGPIDLIDYPPSNMVYLYDALPQAIKELLRTNPMGFPIPSNSCTYWNVYKSSCWTWYDGDIMMPCASGCCHTYYTVCDNNGNISVTATYSISSDDVCTSPPCWNVCPSIPEFKTDHGNDLSSPTTLGIQSSGPLPNPTNEATIIPFHVPSAMHVTVVIYDIEGNHIAKLLDKDCAAGDQEVQFIPNNLPNGTYIYKITGDGSTAIGKIILAR